MKKIILLICLFIFSGCAGNLENSISESKITAECTYEMNEDYLALHVPIQSAFYNNQLHLYMLDTLSMVQNVSLNKLNQVFGFYQDGYYSISLDKNIAHLYSNDQVDRQITINEILSREKWSNAFVSFDGKLIYYFKDSTLYVWTIETQTEAKVHAFTKDVSFVTNNEHGAYVLAGDEYYKILNSTVEKLENVDYVSDHFYIHKIDEKTLQLTNISTNEIMMLPLENENEEIVTSNENGILTQYETSFYFYEINEHLVHHFDFEDIETIVMDENNTIYGVSSNQEIKTYTLEDSVKVSLVLDLMRTRDEVTETKIIEAPIMAQLPNYPAGCESISTMMLLKHIGEDISADTFIDEYLDKGAISFSNGVMYAPNPNKAFVGSPKTDEAYGCFTPVIEEALIQYFGSDKYIENTSGLSLDDICHNYIDRDYPVLVWASINMLNIYPTSTWITPEGESYTWLANEHCLLLVGYDENYYYFNDPWTGSRKAYNKSVVENRYKTLGSQSLTILKK